MWWLWYSHILKRNIQLTITLHNMVIKKVLIFCTVITKSKDPDTFCFGQKSLPGVRIIFSRLSGEQGRNLSSYRNAEWITQQRGSQREEFYVKAQKCKKSYYRSGGHSHNSVEKKEGNCFIKRRSDNFKKYFPSSSDIALQPSTFASLSKPVASLFFFILTTNCCLQPILFIVGKSIGNSTDKNLEQKLHKSKSLTGRTLWQNCSTRCTIHVAMCLKDKFLDQCYSSTC